MPQLQARCVARTCKPAASPSASFHLAEQERLFPACFLFTHTDFNGMPSSGAEALLQAPGRGKEEQRRAKELREGECSWVKKEG